MAIKYTIQGLLIYVTIATYLGAFLTLLAGRRKLGRTLALVSFLVALVSLGYRWYDVRHVPLQNLFEVFLFLGLLCDPISWFSRRILRIGHQWADMLLGAIVLFPAGFIFTAQPLQLPPALQSWLFGPHVAVYMIAYIFMAKATVQAVDQLCRRPPRAEGTARPPERATYELIAIGFPLLTLGLILGSWWGKLAWGRYWGWDPKELWSLASWLVYLGYFHWRYLYGKKYPSLNSLWAITGMVAIIVTLLWVNLSQLFPGLHSYAT